MQLLSSFKSVKFGLLVGIGGGIPSEEADIRLSDVVVGLPTTRSTNGGMAHYDLRKATRGGKLERTGCLNRRPQILATAVSKLRAIHQMEGSQTPSFVNVIGRKYPRMRDLYTGHGHSDLLFEAGYLHKRKRPTCSKCSTTRLVDRRERKSKEPVIHYGTIALGIKVIKDTQVRDRIGRKLGAYCVEMKLRACSTTIMPRHTWYMRLRRLA
ncbi:uncharacterized protein BDV17DRAFT_255589 [Aspergillus undulatus]|uniref:uncharacterized protein n=1 Tax=Aspergillus undulatus TaxID=1810928 RepID=UPI003CCE49EF